VNRPCIGCGTVITSGSRCQDCKLPDRPRTRTTAHAGSDWRWRKLSARMRKLSPFCEKCGRKNKSSLTVDHVIPVSDDATLAYEPLNLRSIANHAMRAGQPTSQTMNAPQSMRPFRRVNNGRQGITPAR
jgi:5-methylcytosine-specific restriction endonuclease McrA